MADVPHGPRVTVEFEPVSGRPMFSATGVWGGFAPNGSLIAEFFVDRVSNPSQIMLEPGPDGNAKEVSRVPAADPSAAHYVRQVQVSVVFRGEDARSIGDWFHQQAQTIEAAAAAAGATLFTGKSGR